ncbi:MAG: class I SAM-dependent methyltransferase [Chloroflexi bacterium]|nr:class I SAM-dependent methyltransferase [Chloroflexota bacterium]
MTEQTDKSVVFDRATAFYDQTRGFPPGVDQQAADLMARLGGITGESVVAEIGVGTGRLALPLARHTGPYLGFDLSSGMMSVLRQKHAAYGAPDVRLALADVTRLPLRSQSLDAAVLVHILHLVSEPEQAAIELRRVVKPGGIAIVGWNRSYEHGLEAMSEAWEAATGEQWRRWRKGEDNRDTGAVVLEQNGWTEATSGVLEFTTTLTPRTKLDRYRGRIYSSMWKMDDETWQAGVTAVEDIVARQYPDPDRSFEVSHEFHVAVFRP